MPSATTADRSDSIPPSTAKVKAYGMRITIRSRLISGRCGAGRVLGTPPKRLPMVSTGRPSKAAITDASATTIRNPGHVGLKRRSSTMTAMEAAATAKAAGFKVGAACHKASSFGRKAAGSRPARANPRRSRNWLARIMTAMPAVKPTITEWGMYLM